VRVDFAYLTADERIGENEAGLPKRFCVVDGSGWVTGTRGESEPTVEAPGNAVYRTLGERHAAGTETGMAAVIIQAVSLDPDATPESVDREPDEGAFRDA
jgi:hypothetical protein